MAERRNPPATATSALGGLDLLGLGRIGAAETDRRIAGQSAALTDILRFQQSLEDAGRTAQAEAGGRSDQLTRDRMAQEAALAADSRSSAAGVAARQRAAQMEAARSEQSLRERLARQDFGFQLGQLIAEAKMNEEPEVGLSDLPTRAVDPLRGALYMEDPRALAELLEGKVTPGGLTNESLSDMAREIRETAPSWAQDDMLAALGRQQGVQRSAGPNDPSPVDQAVDLLPRLVDQHYDTLWSAESTSYEPLVQELMRTYGYSRQQAMAAASYMVAQTAHPGYGSAE